jgi:hypothetical protein
MKTKITILLMSLLAGACSFAQPKDRGIIGKTNSLAGWSNIKPNKFDYPESTKVLIGSITSNTTLSSAETYLITGKVYVTNNATLTIEPGTILRGDFDTKGCLVIGKGAKIDAIGVQNNPIVFTSNKSVGERKPGDWAGIIMMGDAPINGIGGVSNVDYDTDAQFRAYGGSNAQSTSGSMKYVRIEFAGYSPDRKKNYNGLSLYAVGGQTKLDYVQVSNSAGNSYKFYGGNVTNANNLFSYRAVNDDFSFTQGAQCVMNNGLAIRNAFATSSSENARCVNLKSYDKKEMTDFSKKMSNITLENFTLLNENDGDASAIGIIREAVYVNSDSNFTMKNSVINGFTPAFLFNSDIQINDANLKKVVVEGVLLNNCKGYFQSEIGGATEEDLENHYANFNNQRLGDPATALFVAPKNDKVPDLRLRINNIN